MNRISVSDLGEIMGNIWTSFLDSAIEPCEAEPAARGHQFVSGVVHLMGKPDAAVVVRCSFALGRMVTAIMTGADEPTAEDVADAVGELANLTAGAVQALLPSPSELTPPTVVEGDDFQLCLPHHRAYATAHFQWESEPLTIVCYEASGPNSAAELHAAGNSDEA
jgi:hypothetical protein